MKLATAGRRCFITGGGGGLGRAFCLQLASRGARLWVADLDLASATESCRLALEQGAASAVALVCDVRDREALEKVARDIETAAGGLDLLINNAGMAAAGSFHELRFEDWQISLDVNFMGVLNGCLAFMPMFRRQKHGRILNIASAAGLLNPPRLSPYNASKAAVISLSESLRAEYAREGVVVTVACPTFFPTGIVKNAVVRGEGMSELAQRLLTVTGASAESTARACLRAVDAGRAYAIPTLDARLSWWFKRLFPGVTIGITGRSLGWAERLLLGRKS